MITDKKMSTEVKLAIVWLLFVVTVGLALMLWAFDGIFFTCFLSVVVVGISAFVLMQLAFCTQKCWRIVKGYFNK